MNQFIEEKYRTIGKKIYLKKGRKNNSFIKKKIRVAILGGSTTGLIRESLSKYLNVFLFSQNSILKYERKIKMEQIS